MVPRKERHAAGGKNRLSRRTGWLAAGVLLLIAGSLVYVYNDYKVYAPVSGALGSGTDEVSVPPKREALSFHMSDFDRGWVEYSDGILYTEDGGLNWRPSSMAHLQELGLEKELLANEAEPAAEEAPYAIKYGSMEGFARQVQFLSERVGWAILENGPDEDDLLLVTADGGATWQAEVTSAVRAAVEAEKERLRKEEEEAGWYASPELFRQAADSTWTLFPATTSPGDVVLVRSKEPGEVEWQGKAYPLKPFGAGYFTYLPLTMDVKPGQYPIGDQVLSVEKKTFETQYLQVSQQMESMRRETDRIAADQKKIDAARSQSADRFLFTDSFLQPVEGRLTTPFGYTRYVNGKYDSSHRAIDLAAKEGTPIMATNDGVVVLSEMLYLTGNSIYIDHGMGLFSQYAHLSELNVKAGDTVKRGDVIGLVGSTGFSTGPHLHFTFWAHNVPVNPNLFFGKTPFDWKDID